MKDTNKKTIQSYESHIAKYIERTPKQISKSVKTWINSTLLNLPANSKIIEIGSGPGTEAKYIEEQGYKVVRSDATKGFVSLLNNQGYFAKTFNLITDEFDSKYDLVFAHAVLLHLTKNEAIESINKIFKTLNNDGRFSFSLKIGKGEKISDEKIDAPRYFNYWQENEITNVLKNVGFNNIEISNGYTRHNNANWLYLIAMK